MASFKSTSIICTLLLHLISGSFAAPSDSYGLQSHAEGSSDDSGTASDPTTQTPTFKCSIADPKLDSFCAEKSTLWRGTPKHDCCYQVLKNDCIKENLEHVCDHEKYRKHFEKITKDTEYILATEDCFKSVNKGYCEPTLSELRGEPIAGWMVTVAGVVCFLLILCAIALGIKFC